MLYHTSQFTQFNHNRAILKNIDMGTFLKYVFQTIHPGKQMLSNWHLDLMIEYLKAIERGEIKRLIVNLPPRSLKSICINVAWPAWLLGHLPNTRIIAVSYNQQLSEKHSIDCRNIIQSEWYQELFPNTMIARGMNTKSKFCTTQGGFRLATSTGGTLTGEGADIIIIDDPLSGSDVFSIKSRTKVYNWFRGCLLSRLNDCINGKIILVMQRLHPDDLTGMILKSESRDMWKILKISAIAQSNDTFALGLYQYTRKTGEHLFDNAYYIDPNGNKILLNRKKIIQHYIPTQFMIELEFLDRVMTKIYCSEPSKYILPNSWLLWEIHHSQYNIFCDKNTLALYENLYCHTIQTIVNQINYKVVFEKFSDNYLPDKKNDTLNIQGINRDFNILRREVGTCIFNIQYQQDASEALNTLIKDEWIYRYDDYEPANFIHLSEIQCSSKIHNVSIFDYIYQSWDCGIKCGVNNDYTVCTTWGLRNGKVYLIHILRTKIDYPRLREAIIKMSVYFDTDAILIEDCAAGQQIIQEMLYANSSENIIAIRPKEDKKTRLTLVSPLFERGIIMIPLYAQWLSPFLDELLNFPDSKHDDQVDSVSQFLLWYQRNEAKKISSKVLNFKLHRI